MTGLHRGVDPVGEAGVDVAEMATYRLTRAASELGVTTTSDAKN